MQDTDNQISVPIIYSNTVNFSWSLYDFTLLFGTRLPDLPRHPQKNEKESPILVQAQAQVMMSPTHFKRFVEIANNVLNDYEAKHGKIATEKKSQ